MESSSTTPELFYSGCPDVNSLISLVIPTVVGVTGNTLFLVTQYEYKTLNNAGVSMCGELPSPTSITTLDQDRTTEVWKAVKYFKVDTKPVNGLWITCACGQSPSNTHLFRKESEPDAVNTLVQAFSQNLFGTTTGAKPYHYGHVPEVTVKSDGTDTGLEVADNLNGFAYVMSNFQHGGDWGSIHSVIKAGVDPFINANWTYKNSAANGYLSGLPTQ